MALLYAYICTVIKTNQNMANCAQSLIENLQLKTHLLRQNRTESYDDQYPEHPLLVIRFRVSLMFWALLMKRDIACKSMSQMSNAGGKNV